MYEDFTHCSNSRNKLSNTFAGRILDIDFETTDYEITHDVHSLSAIAKRMASDEYFDRQCKRNIELRENFKKRGKSKDENA